MVFARTTKLILVLLFAAITHPNCCEAQLQKAVDQALEKSAGTIVVSDVESGKVLAQKNINLAAKQLVRPGSTLKPFVLEELLTSGRIDSKQRLLCKRPLRIGSLRLDCSHSSDVKTLNAEEAVAYSCNSYLAEVTPQLSPSELAGLLRRAGLDSPTGIVEDEATGRITLPATREQLQLMTLGLRGIEVSPLELLEAYRRLALRGNAVTHPASSPVFAGLENAVKYGTAHGAFVEGLTIAGKTGTATNADGSASHGLFVGYAPAEHPDIVVLVYVAGSRGLDAAAVARRVFAQYKETGKKP